MPVCLPADPPGPVSFHGVPKFTGKGKGNPVMGQMVSQYKQFCPQAGNSFPPLKYFPYFIPSLKPFNPSKPERRRLPPEQHKPLIRLLFVGNAQFNPAFSPAAF
jgi:hypothetical protein